MATCTRTGINKSWHEKNKMPKNPTFEERVKWHLDHEKNCPCRAIPGKLREEMKQKKEAGTGFEGLLIDRAGHPLC